MDGVGLSEAGRRESRALARRLAGRAITAIYCSPLQRARETAEIIAEASGLNPVRDEAINEIDFGDWTGARFKDLDGQPAWDRWNVARGQHRPPNGESMLELQLRVSRRMESLINEHRDQTIVAVCHGDVIRAALAHALGLSLDRHDRFDIAPAALSVIVGGDWGLKVHSINEVADDSDVD